MNKEYNKIQNQWLEVDLILEAIYRKYGHDFRNYSRSHIKRRLEHRLSLSGVQNYGQMQHQIIHDEIFFKQILLDLSINVTEMFRDPKVYKTIRELVIPHLMTYPSIKIWHAGCSAGQEVYSMAILLQEEKIQNRAQLYATDFNEKILEKAKQGIYPVKLIRDYTGNYQKAGGKYSFSDYYRADYENAVISQSLKKNILFSSHNLVTDGIFGEMQLIFCRNVLIYFNQELQNRVLNIFSKSLCPGGFLCLGTKENLQGTAVESEFELIAAQEKIYRKKR